MVGVFHIIHHQMINGFTLESIVFFTNGEFTIDLNGLIDVNAPLTENNKRRFMRF
jgi:hypothetical protein